MTKYSEGDLIIPTLQILNKRNKIGTKDLIEELKKFLKPDVEDLKSYKDRKDTRFS